MLNGLLEEASLLVEGYLGVTYTEAVPDAVRVVASRVVARALTAPDDVPEGGTAVTLRTLDFSSTRNFGGEGRSNLWLSKQDKTMLGALGGGGMAVVGLSSERFL